MPDPTPEEQERIDQLRARVADMDLPEGATIDFEVVTADEMPARIDAADAAVFLPAKSFAYYRAPGLPVLPAIELDGPGWLEQAIRDGRASCQAYGIGNAIEGVEVPRFASFQFSVGDAYTPVMIWLDGADDDWLERALSRFVVVFEPGPDGKRAFVATGPLRRYPAGLVVPPKTGRNSPCPCGSGKKFKRCHGG